MTRREKWAGLGFAIGFALFAVVVLSTAQQTYGPSFVVPGSGGTGGSGTATNIGSSTNASAAVAMTNLAWGRTLFVDSVFGNNATAIRGDASKPWASPVWAASNALAGDTIFLRPGNYILTISNVVLLPHGVSLRGQDRATTWITKTNGDAAGPVLTPGSGSTISDLTLIAWTPGGDDPTNLLKVVSPDAWTPAPNKFWTNAVFINCDLIGETDIYFVSGNSPCSARFEGCRFRSEWDVIVTGNRPQFTEFLYCDFLTDARSHTNGRVGVFGEVTILKTGAGSTNLFHNCRIIATNSHEPTNIVEGFNTHGAFIVYDSGSQANTTYTHFANCFMVAAGTNCANRFAGPNTNNWINSNNLIRVWNCNPHIVSPFNTNYFADHNDGTILMTNTGPARTITLPNIGPYGRPVWDQLDLTIVDGTSTGDTNTILIKGILGQRFFPSGTTQTNLTAAWGTVKLRVRGTNWWIEGTYP